MGHKVHPTGFRLGVIRDWQAKWYADKHYAEYLLEDLRLREAIQSRYADAAVSLCEIERQANQISVTIHTARPGIVIGRGGQRVDDPDLHRDCGDRIQPGAAAPRPGAPAGQPGDCGGGFFGADADRGAA